jgi:hypothetical protein
MSAVLTQRFSVDDLEIRDLIRQISSENPTWGVPRIQAELHLLGYKVAESTVAKYRIRIRKPPSQTWKSFLRNHSKDIVAIDFFVAPTVTFNILYGFVVLLHNRRQVVHFNATAHPTAVWTAQQIIEAFPEDTAPRFVLRDRDSKYGEEVSPSSIKNGNRGSDHDCAVAVAESLPQVSGLHHRYLRAA